MRKESQIKRRGRVAASILTVAAVATALSNVAVSNAWGQTGTATEKKGAGSLLDSTQPNGRFNGERYDGAIKPALKSGQSRFSNRAVRGSAGNVVGLDANRTGGRFSGASEFQSKQNFELFYWRNEVLRTKSALERAERTLGGGSSRKDGPRLTTAKEPKPVTLTEWRRGVRYGRTQEEVAAARQAELEAARQTALLPNAGIGKGDATALGEEYDPATIWMRGRAPISDWTQAPFDLRTRINGELGGVWGTRANGGVEEAEANGGGWVELDGRVRSEFAGASLTPNGASIASISELLTPLPSPEEKRRVYQEYLTKKTK